MPCSHEAAPQPGDETPEVATCAWCFWFLLGYVLLFTRRVRLLNGWTSWSFVAWLSIRFLRWLASCWSTVLFCGATVEHKNEAIEKGRQYCWHKQLLGTNGEKSLLWDRAECLICLYACSV